MKALARVFLASRFICALASGAAAFPPTIDGNRVMCDGEEITLSTQPYDSYQWYKMSVWDSLNHSGTFNPIAGATSRTLKVNKFHDAANYFKVSARLGEESAFSPAILVDGWAFLPIHFKVELVGTLDRQDFDGTWYVHGDTYLILTLGMPYDTNIAWKRDGVPIPGGTATRLTVRSTGVYTVEAAPKVCPDFIQEVPPAFGTKVVFTDQPNGVRDPALSANRASPTLRYLGNTVTIEMPGKSTGGPVSIFGIDGRKAPPGYLVGEKAAGFIKNR